jgi:hypothetical protein
VVMLEKAAEATKGAPDEAEILDGPRAAHGRGEGGREGTRERNNKQARKGEAIEDEEKEEGRWAAGWVRTHTSAHARIQSDTHAHAYTHAHASSPLRSLTHIAARTQVMMDGAGSDDGEEYKDIQINLG